MKIMKKYKYTERIVKCKGYDGNIYTMKAIRFIKSPEYEFLVPLEFEISVRFDTEGYLNVRFTNKCINKNAITGKFDQLYNIDDKEEALSILKYVVPNCEYVDLFFKYRKIYNIGYDYPITEFGEAYPGQYIKIWDGEYPEKDFTAYKNIGEDKYNDT